MKKKSIMGNFNTKASEGIVENETDSFTLRIETTVLLVSVKNTI